MTASRSLQDFVDRHRLLFVLTGAGCSVNSGIPDYRDADGKWKRVPPVSYQAFMGEEATRRRYWARSLAQLSEIGVLGQKSVAGMEAFGAHPLRQRDDRLAVEIARGADADLVRLVGQPRVQGAAIGRRRQRDRPQAHPPRRADDATGDLATIGDQDVGEHEDPERSSWPGLPP